MSREKIAFIINPTSGNKRKRNMVAVISRHLDLKRYDPQFWYTEQAGHASKLASQLALEGYKKIVAVGGDGTVNEVASTLIDLNTSFGIIPIGSGNGLARYLGISVRMAESVGVINKGKTMRIDAGSLNKGWFFCTCGVGFDARVGHEFSKGTKRGFKAYLKVIMREFSKYKPRKYKFTIDGVEYVRRAFLITIANAGQYGNNAYIAPGAKIDDGWFDVCILNPFPLIKSLALGVRLFNRSIESAQYMEVIRGKEIEFRKTKKKYIFHYDGEPVKFKKRKVKISMHYHCLEVMIPEKSQKKQYRSKNRKARPVR
jgi:diacylglycerol kinase (ATP)